MRETRSNWERYISRKTFYHKKSYLKYRLQKDVMENGIAYIPCRVDGIGDIISKFSVQGCESLDDEFMNFIMEFMEFIPKDYPAVLEIYGPKFTEEEKERIVECILAEMDYQLGKTEAQNKHHRKVFIWMVVGTILSGALLGFIRQFILDFPLEFFYVLFWLFADALVRYVFIEGFAYRNDKIRAGQIASMNVEFVEVEET